jgi:hypothetical protein
MIDDIIRLDTWHQEAGYDRLAEYQHKGRGKYEVLFSGAIPPNIVRSNVPPFYTRGHNEKYPLESHFMKGVRHRYLNLDNTLSFGLRSGRSFQ